MTDLFHYCSTSNFVSIISSKTIWLSSLNLSNDTMEGKLVAKIIGLLAKRDGLEPVAIMQLQEAVAFYENFCDGLGFCLSEEGDLLSQWRGYASDATGLAIGFSEEYLSSLSQSLNNNNWTGFTLEKVEYDVSLQEELVRPTYEEIKQLVYSGQLQSSLLTMRTDDDIIKELTKFQLDPLNMRTDDEIINELIMFKFASINISLSLLSNLYLKLFALKTAAFHEEREWRLISYTTREGDDSCLYRALNDRIIPYKAFNLTNLETSPITEVIIGPKNLTPIYIVDKLLKKYGFNNVTINRSCATYR